MIKGRCHTNIDEAKHKKWPTMFAAVPRIGETVQARCGYELKVCRIAYYEMGVNDLGYESANDNSVLEPRIAVELTKQLPY
jgi:hypothetical protein